MGFGDTPVGLKFVSTFSGEYSHFPSLTFEGGSAIL
jgi:hypothetical protein